MADSTQWETSAQPSKWKAAKDKRREARANDPKVLRRKQHHLAVEFAANAGERARQLRKVVQA